MSINGHNDLDRGFHFLFRVVLVIGMCIRTVQVENAGGGGMDVIR
jgi:hypothetical protein